MTSWYTEQGSEDDVIISSRVRLARNFKNYPFPIKMTKEQGTEVINNCKNILIRDNLPINQKFKYISMSDMNPVEKQVMFEKHLISLEMLKNIHSRGVILSEDEKVNIMINEEDHLRIQCLLPGMQLDECWNLVNKVDNIIESKNEYAFSEDYGYLTCCPTNVGTGIRASVMIHLPALAATGYLKSLISAVNKLGIAVRGFYGEGSEVMGNIFQISNQITLGVSEEETINNLKGIVTQIIEQERAARRKLFKTNKLKLEDMVYRSYGLFSNARIISYEECIKLLSDVRLGVYMGIIDNIPKSVLNEILIETQPANIMMKYNNNLQSEERDIKRSEIIKDKIKQH